MLTVRNKKQFLGRVATATIAVVPFALGTALLITPHTAKADVTTYSTSKRIYKVGILLIDSTADANLDGVISPAEAIKGAENPDPFVFFIADQRSDIKPGGWELDNPLAPSTITSDIYDRWSGTGGRDPGHPYTIGQKVTKDMAAYWEVSLSKATVPELLEYDVLFITNHRETSFSAKDREKLRKVVDAGGVVWLDNCGNMTIGAGGRFFLEELQMNNPTNTPAAERVDNDGTPGPSVVQPTHPLLNSPYTLSFTDILRLGDKSYGNYFLTTQPVNASNTAVATAPNKESLTTIIANTAKKDVNIPGAYLPYISAGVYGSGAVIVSCADIGCGVNDYSGGFNAGSGGNSGAFSGTDLNAANIEDLKFVYNAIAWGGANNTVRRNNRRTASSSSAISAPLNPAFDFSKVPPSSIDASPVVQSTSSPLISQGIMYVAGKTASGNVTLRAYDTIPGRDYDNDGNNDDGRQDLITGTPYDEIWRWEGGAYAGKEPSSPVLATVTQGGISGDQILITLPDGSVLAFNARPLDSATKRLLPTNNPQYTNGPVNTGSTYNMSVAPSPIFFANKVYVVEPKGALVRCVNADGFSTEWTSTDPALSSPQVQSYAPTGTPTLGLNRLVVNRTRDVNRTNLENTIAGNTDESTNDVMLYVPVLDSSSSPAAAKILPFWLGSRNEGTKDLNSDGTDTLARFRPASTNNDQYFVSKGGNGFITPSATIYADVKITVGGVDTIYTREENYAAGRAVYPVVDSFFTSQGYGDTWGAVWQDSTYNSAYYSGRIQILHNGAPASTATDRVLVVGDYDLVFVPFSGTGPAYLTGPSAQPGHRNAGPLTIPNSTGVDSVAFAPNDLLIYEANQTADSGGLFGAIFGMQEREFSLSASRLRWRYLLHDEILGKDVNGQTVNELPALRNRLTFNSPQLATLSTTAPNFYEALTEVKFVGSPITTNDDVTYALASATSAANGNAKDNVTVLMAFQTSPQITLNLGRPIEQNTSVSVSQWDPLKDAVISTSGDPNDRTRVDVDFASGRVTIADFGALNNGENLFSASSSFVVSYVPANGQNGTGAVGQPVFAVVKPFGSIPNVTGTTNDLVLDGSTGPTSGGFSPLLWYYVLPGRPQPGTSPVKIGDQIFYTNTAGQVIAVDADPASNDPTVRLRSGEQVYGVVDQIQTGSGAIRNVDRNHVRWTGTVVGGAGGSPSGDEGILAINTPNGTMAFSEGVTVVADTNRIMEVNADGAATWSTDGTTDVAIVGGAAISYGADGRIVTPDTTRGVKTYNQKPFHAPQSVRRLSVGDYLVADTGSNRVVRFDRAGVSRWSLERMNDPYGVLAPGDPLTLDAPTDVLTRTLTTFDTANAKVGYEVHYLIADSGNGRILDVVDYYDLNGNPKPVVAGQPSNNVVVWSTRTKSKNGQNLSYHNLQLIAGRDNGPDGMPGTADDLYGKPILVATVGNSSVAAANNNASTNGSGGSLVQLDYNPYNTGFILVDRSGAVGQIKYYWTQTAGATLPYNPTSAAVVEPTTNGDVLLAINEMRTVAAGAVTRTKRINTPTYFEQIPLDLTNDGIPESVYLIADADGVYACVVNVDTTTGQSYFDILWQFTQTDYDRINGTRLDLDTVSALPRLSPASVKRLANGHFLITNSAAGASGLFASGQFAGEVFEVSLPRIFNTNSTEFDIDTATGKVQNTVNGSTVYADFSVPRILKGSGGNGTGTRVLNQQQMGRDKEGASLTEQPRSADRL